jgi:hypothetical protein
VLVFPWLTSLRVQICSPLSPAREWLRSEFIGSHAPIFYLPRCLRSLHTIHRNDLVRGVDVALSRNSDICTATVLASICTRCFSSPPIRNLHRPPIAFFAQRLRSRGSTRRHAAVYDSQCIRLQRLRLLCLLPDAHEYTTDPRIPLDKAGPYPALDFFVDVDWERDGMRTPIWWQADDRVVRAPALPSNARSLLRYRSSLHLSSDVRLSSRTLPHCSSAAD